jgi:hypothetical protein
MGLQRNMLTVLPIMKNVTESLIKVSEVAKLTAIDGMAGA